MNPAISSSAPASTVMLTPMRRIITAGTMPVSPQASPSRVKPKPASAQFHLSSVTIEGSTRPSELKVVAVNRK
jgi:hypothetical protein